MSNTLRSKDEIKVQRHIKDSAKAQGGASVKLSNQFLIGVPDLLIGLPPYCLTLVEVKDLGECRDKFSRKLEVTDKQDEMMERFSLPYEDRGGSYNARMASAFLMVALYHKGQHRLIAAPRWARQMTHEYEGTLPWVTRQTGCLYDLLPLFGGMGGIKWRVG